MATPIDMPPLQSSQQFCMAQYIVDSVFHVSQILVRPSMGKSSKIPCPLPRTLGPDGDCPHNFSVGLVQFSVHPLELRSYHKSLEQFPDLLISFHLPRPNILEFDISVHKEPHKGPYQYWSDNCYCMRTPSGVDGCPNSL